MARQHLELKRSGYDHAEVLAETGFAVVTDDCAGGMIAVNDRNQ